MLRYLRIVCSLFFFALSCGVAALWVRSYSIADCSWTNDPYASFMSVRGLLIVNVTGNPFVDHIPYSDLARHFTSDPVSLDDDPTWWEKDSTLGFHRVEVLKGRIWYSVPHWAPLALSFAIGMGLLLGLLRRFSLRGLLLMSTAFAVILGTGVCLVK
jgi:hypothetical protein